MMLEQQIDHIIRPALMHEGYDVVCVRLSGQKRLIVQVFIERTDDQPLSLDDCAKASPIISALLDVEDPISDAYTLEVSSPGLERPLWRLEDYARFCGRTIKFHLTEAVNGQKRFTGTIHHVQDPLIGLIIHREGQDEERAIPFSAIQKAHLIHP